MMKLIRCICLLVMLPVVGSGQIITTVAGNGQPGYTGDGGLAINAKIGFPGLLTIDKAQNLYISALNNTVRKVSPAGIITKVAGTGTAGYSGDGGLAVNAEFDFTGGGGMACDSLGNLFIADQANNRIRKIEVATGIVTTVIGVGTVGFSGDNGPALTAELNSPVSVVFDTSGNLYINDGFNYRIRRVDVNGIITTIAGDGVMGPTGDNGPAINARITSAGNITIDYSNNLLITEGLTVRKIDLTTGIITTIAGDGGWSYNGDSIPAIIAHLSTVLDAVGDKAGNIYISNSGQYRVRKVTTDGLIHTAAGTGVSGYNGDSILATTAQFSSPRGIALDSCGNLYIADNGNYRIRKISFNDSCGILSTQLITASTSKFSIHPNPATSTITITSNNKIKQVTITDITGREVLYSTENTIDVSGLVSGVYFVRVRDVSGGSRTEKIIKQ